jgi:DNA-binding MarR family transcriptional regulator
VTNATFFRVSYVIARLDRAIRRGIEERLAPHGLSVSQYTALSVLRNRPGLSNAQLARRSFVTPQAMYEVTASLEEAKLIVREVDRNRPRILRARLTARGDPLFERLERRSATSRSGCSPAVTRGAPAVRRDRCELRAQARRGPVGQLILYRRQVA